jgi:DNA-binding transcriptional LysR family regulator
MKIDLVSLSLFVTVAEERNIARAAARRNIAASAVSKRLMDLEQAFATPLLIRQSKGVSLTPAGEALAQHTRMLIEFTGRVEAEMSAYASGMRGQVRLSANPSAIIQFLPGLLAQFFEAYPDIEIVMVEHTTNRSLRLLEEGLADLAIVGWGAEHPDMIYAPFRTDDLVLVVPAGHALSESGKSVPFVAALSFPFVGLEEGSSLQARLEVAAYQAGFQMRSKLRMASFEGVRRMVEAGIGIAVLPVSTVKPYSATMGIRAVPLADPWAQRELRIVSRDLATLSVPVMLLRNWLLQT